jgi:hypothetical protein
MRWRTVVALAHILLAAEEASAQSLSQLIPNLFGAGGLTVRSETQLPDGSNHSAHFNSSFQQSFTPFNTALASQLAAVPLPSPASGFTYTFDSSLGVFKRSTQSFGPILSDRADTVGRHKLAIGFNFQHFNFDSIDGVGLSSVPVVFTHDNPVAGTGRDDLVVTSNHIEVELGQFTAFLNYGLLDRLDVCARFRPPPVLQMAQVDVRELSRPVDGPDASNADLCTISARRRRLWWSPERAPAFKH